MICTKAHLGGCYGNIESDIVFGILEPPEDVRKTLWEKKYNNIPESAT